MDWFEIAEEMLPKVKSGDTGAVIARVSDVLRFLPESPFHNVLSLDFTNRPEDIAGHFDHFLKFELDVPLLATSHEYDFIAEFRK